MSNATPKTPPLVLTGLDGGNPLAFLAALGTLRTLTKASASSAVRMSWIHTSGAWCPVLYGPALEEVSVLNSLHHACQAAANHRTLAVADNLTIKPVAFRKHALVCLDSEDRDAAAYIAAFGSDAIEAKDSKGNTLVTDTALRTMSGAGHQHFLKTMREVLAKTEREHLRRALFEAWDYTEPLRGLSLRFDPVDDKRYAHQWVNPSDDSTRGSRGSMLGANALAVLGIPLLPVAPARGELQTTGFRGTRASDCSWTWPIWKVPLNLDVVASLLAQAELLELHPPRDALSKIGVADIFRSRRITTDKFRSFTPAAAI